LDPAREAYRGQHGTYQFFEEPGFEINFLQEQRMSSLKEKEAVVIGAGIGGLAAAKALANHFGRVTVLDRDRLPSEAEPRVGTPQARHTHALIAGGLKALTVLFPGFDADVDKAGGVKMRAGLDPQLERPGFDPFPKRDLGWDTYSASRPLFELAVRRRIERQENIKLLPKSRVTELIRSPDGTAVTAVRWESSNGETHTSNADLVVDASGRGTLTLAFLETLGLGKPEETEIGIDQAYSTAIFEIPTTAPSGWKGVMVLPSAPTSSRGAFLFPIEQNKWIVSAGANHGDAPPGDLAGFLEFLKSLRTQTIYDAVKEARLVGEMARFVLPSSMRRHFEKMEKFPRGLLSIGDVICRFNPVFGQGMSVAAQEAVILDGLLASKAKDLDALDGLGQQFFTAIQGVLETPWAVAMSDFAYPKTRGHRPPDFGERMQYSIALIRLAAEDPAIHKLAAEVNNLLKPQSALRDPDISYRVKQRMAAVA
jgi:2-polyprenyl-6-methoxyphenol hydroxylase-like FAD-dependent oxidoreductase